MNKYIIPAGTRVKVGGEYRTQQRTRVVTAIESAPRARGKTRVTWVSGGRTAVATV